MLGVLHDLLGGCVNGDFSFVSKYPNTFDLRPNAHTYSSSFIYALVDAGVPALLHECISPDMTLMHTQVRTSLPGPSYMDWHRDTYTHDGVTIGNVPPVHKVIFYPAFGSSPQPKLKVIVGSNRLQFTTAALDTTLSTDASRVVTYDSSDERFTLFDTSTLHAAIPETTSAGSIRIIYSFMRRNQFMRTLASEKLHAEQSVLYDAMVNHT